MKMFPFTLLHNQQNKTQNKKSKKESPLLSSFEVSQKDVESILCSSFIAKQLKQQNKKLKEAVQHLDEELASLSCRSQFLEEKVKTKKIKTLNLTSRRDFYRNEGLGIEIPHIKNKGSQDSVDSFLKLRTLGGMTTADLKIPSESKGFSKLDEKLKKNNYKGKGPGNFKSSLFRN